MSQVILVFLITAWSAFLFLVAAYFGRLLPPEHIRWVDKACIHVNSDNCEDEWKRTLDTVILTFSDQQLITGLTILIAGYTESAFHGLSAHHWQIVVFLGWMSSTVHLASLTLLRPWLNRNLLLRNLRLSGMVTLLALLAAALYPSTSKLYLFGVATSLRYPVRCFWDQSWRAQAVTGGINNDAIVSYITLFSGYIWKIAQLLDGTHHRLRRYILVPPVAKLERLARQNADPMPTKWTLRWTSLRLIIYAHVLLVVLIEVVDSFAATLLFLLTSLTWGTLQLSRTRSWATQGVLDAERTFSFGQLLPLLLLLQPIFTIVEHFAKTADNSEASTQSSHSHG